MADSDRNFVTQTHDQRPAPGGLNHAAGRTSEDLATDSPATFGPDPLAGDASDMFSGDDAGTNAGSPAALPTKKRDPNLPPDERLGLRPTIKGDAAPDSPVNPDLYGV